MEQIQVVQNDKGYDLIFEITNEDESVMDLTTATSVRLHAIRSGDASTELNGLANITDATQGVVNYTVQATDFEKAGSYYAEIQISFGNDKVITLPTFEIRVQTEIA